MVEPFAIQGDAAWLKHYDTHRRRIRLGALKVVTRWLALSPLRPPPHHTGERAKQVEARRLRELRRQGVLVPEILGEGRDSLVLSHVGETLAASLRRQRGDAACTDALARGAISAIAGAHRGGAYFGQPLPRNMTVREGVVGFLDFEEDPLEVMDLAQAQARDWLLFTYGMVKYYEARPEALAQLLRAALREEPAAVVRHARGVAHRLHRLGRLSQRLGRSARSLANTVQVMRAATSLMVLLGVMLFDFCLDGELDLLNMLAGG